MEMYPLVENGCYTGFIISDGRLQRRMLHPACMKSGYGVWLLTRLQRLVVVSGELLEMKSDGSSDTNSIIREDVLQCTRGGDGGGGGGVVVEWGWRCCC